MAKYTVTLTDKMVEGYTAEAARTGETVAVLVDRIAGERGMEYYQNVKRNNLQATLRKAEKYADRMKTVIDQLYNTIQAEEVAAAAVAEKGE